jgi:hypothetical protein
MQVRGPVGGHGGVAAGGRTPVDPGQFTVELVSEFAGVGMVEGTGNESQCGGSGTGPVISFSLRSSSRENSWT